MPAAISTTHAVTPSYQTSHIGRLDEIGLLCHQRNPTRRQLNRTLCLRWRPPYATMLTAQQPQCFTIFFGEKNIHHSFSSSKLCPRFVRLRAPHEYILHEQINTTGDPESVQRTIVDPSNLLFLATHTVTPKSKSSASDTSTRMGSKKHRVLCQSSNPKIFRLEEIDPFVSHRIP